ncbi:MAG: DUF5317 domain-containing protein [Chloroflexaceae bacterium]|nr:DUF5317 domain-containing protein [Chloroflexaceae bacterium]
MLAIMAVCAATIGVLAVWRPPQPVRSWPLLGLAALPQLFVIFGMRSPWLVLVSLLALGLWGWRNRGVPGVALVLAGCTLNLGMMLLHGGAMPIDTDILAQLGYNKTHGTHLVGSKDVALDSFNAALFSDWLVLHFPTFTVIASPGDFLLLLGLVWWIIRSKPLEVSHDRRTIAPRA